MWAGETGDRVAVKGLGKGSRYACPSNVSLWLFAHTSPYDSYNEFCASANAFVASSLQSEARICAPIFLAPILALLKSSFTLKSGAAVYAFVKASFLGKLLAPAFAYLKSVHFFKVASFYSKAALGVVSALRLQARRILRWWHGFDDFHALNMAREEAFSAGGRSQRIPYFHRTTKVLFAVPIVLVSTAIVASLERTPLTGRWRIIMMDENDEVFTIEDFLKPGSPPGSHLDWSLRRDWVEILRYLEKPDIKPPGTVDGYPVVDFRTDWRAKWVLNILSRIEDSANRMDLTSHEITSQATAIDIGETRLVLPPFRHPFEPRAATRRIYGHVSDEPVDGLVMRFGCLVVDAPSGNAYSIGFGPGLPISSGMPVEGPGVVVVYTGLIDEIISERQRVMNEAITSVSPPQPSSSNLIVGLFSSAVSRTGKSRVAFPAPEDADQLAAVLAHELSHILLSHSLEDLSSGSMSDLLTSFFTDCESFCRLHWRTESRNRYESPVLRTALYPVTAFLGPGFNDWIGSLIHVNSKLGLHITNNCNKRQSEREADLLALRILVNAGIDPRVMRDLFSEGGLYDRIERKERKSVNELAQVECSTNDAASWEGASWLARYGFYDTHPSNEERRKAIDKELEMWMELGRQSKLEELRRKGPDVEALTDDQVKRASQ